MSQTGPFRALVEELKAGRVSRRDFLAGAAKLGVGLPVAAFVLNAVKVDAVHAQDAAAPAERPAVGTEGQTRGAGGELKILQWQAATHAFQHVATGTKDQLAASLVSEPLLSFLPDFSIIPTLAAEVPSVENGQLAEDFSSVTFKLKEGVTWSDGTPLTSADVKFTWEWIVNPENASIDGTTWGVIASVDTPDDLTAVVTFAEPTSAWYVPFTGSYLGTIIPKHVLEAGGDANQAFLTNPIGTGPYKVESLTENDQVIYVVNENYREPNKPFFERVNLKGGGDAASAAQAVMQTGDWDFAWNLQVEPQVLRDLEEGGNGTVKASPATNVERILINFSDPNDESMGERSHKDVPHPFWSDVNVRQALSLATDRQTLATEFYLGGDLEPPAQNILSIPGIFESTTSTPFEFNLEKAAAALDAAGWTLDGDVRTKDGRELEITYSTSINAVRQKTQAVMKDNLESIGFKVQLKRVDPGIFFDSAAGNEQNAQHFYEDLLMYTNGPTSSFPLNYMASWYGGEDNISQKSNGWSGVNEARYNNADYNALYEQAQASTDPEAAADLLIQMNDHVINNVVVVPQVARAAEKYAIANTLRDENVASGAAEALYWNIANWNRVS